jgi:cyclophilin family peptidyl-prolyl cis-trans isomerase
MKRTLFFSVIVCCAMNATAQKNKIEMITDSGRIVLELYDYTPKNTENMVKLAREHFYDSLMFHRIIPAFMIQGGDSTSRHAKPGQPLGMGGLGYTVPAEINDSAFHKRGALAVARTNTPDKSGSACQFYIVVGKKWTDDELNKMEAQRHYKIPLSHREVYKSIGGTPHLDGDYTVFGEVLEGMDVVDKIVAMPSDRSKRPLTDIRMLRVRVMDNDAQPDVAKKKKRGFFRLFRRHRVGN